MPLCYVRRDQHAERLAGSRAEPDARTTGGFGDPARCRNHRLQYRQPGRHAHGNVNADQHARGSTNADQRAHGNANADQHAHGNANADQHAHGNVNADQHANGNTNADQHANGNANADQHAYGHANADQHGLRTTPTADQLTHGSTNADGNACAGLCRAGQGRAGRALRGHGRRELEIQRELADQRANRRVVRRHD